MRALFPLALAALTACDMTPPTVEGRDIDDAVAMGKIKTVCKGLEMKDDEVRRYAASRLEEMSDPEAAECICTWAQNDKGHWDEAILKGLTGSDRDDMVGCFVSVLDDPTAERSLELVVALSDTQAPSVAPKLMSIAKDSSRDSEIRARALGYFLGSTDAGVLADLGALLAGDGDATVRAAAADALVGQKGETEQAALLKAAKDDADGVVRAAALKAVKRAGGEGADQMVCDAMMNDESPAVRTAAVLSLKGTRREPIVSCLRDRALTEEEDDGVRAALLAVLKSSPTDAAADVLCDAIPFFVKTYVDEQHPTDMTGADIITAQNDRDWERSYDCVQKALRSRGAYTCKGSQYVGAWFRELGGEAYVPKCPGDEDLGGGGGEVSFE